MEAIYVGGVHGVGKSTLLKLVGQRRRLPYEIIGFSSEMSRLSDVAPDNLNELANPARTDLIIRTYQNLLSRQRDFILDSHYSVLIVDDNQLRFELGIPLRHVGQFAGFVLLEASPEIVRHRRLNCNDTLTALRLIELECVIEHQFADFIASCARKAVLHVDASGDVNATYENFGEAIKQL